MRFEVVAGIQAETCGFSPRCLRSLGTSRVKQPANCLAVAGHSLAHRTFLEGFSQNSILLETASSSALSRLQRPRESYKNIDG
jgi:hypothetical protein